MAQRYPLDPIDFIVKEKWITITALGSIFTFSMVTKFREFVFEPILAYLLPLESFEFMQIELPDEGPTPPSNANAASLEQPIPVNGTYTIRFGPWIRETIVWLFMIFILYLMAVAVRWPTVEKGSPGSAVM